MAKPARTVAQQIAEAARTFEERLTGRVPGSVAVVLSEETLVITLHGALWAVELAGQKPGRSRRGPGLPPAAIRQLVRTTAAGDQTDYRRRST